MRNGQNKRMRGRNRKGQNPLTRVYESNGPDVKIRGTASHVADKYVQLARDAQSSGDPVAAENYYQHAEHYFRLIASMQEQFRQAPPFYRENDARDGGYEDGEEDSPEAAMGGESYAEQPQPYPPREQPYHQRDQRHGRERDRSDHRRDRDHGDRDRDRGDRNHQPYQQQRPQPGPPQPQPQTAAEDGGDVARLPAFVTGGAPQPSAPAAAHGPNGHNGFEGAPDRFPLHRRRRRRHGGREGSGDPPETVRSGD